MNIPVIAKEIIPDVKIVLMMKLMSQKIWQFVFVFFLEDKMTRRACRKQW